MAEHETRVHEPFRATIDFTFPAADIDAASEVYQRANKAVEQITGISTEGGTVEPMREPAHTDPLMEASREEMRQALYRSADLARKQAQGREQQDAEAHTDPLIEAPSTNLARRVLTELAERFEERAREWQEDADYWEQRNQTLANYSSVISHVIRCYAARWTRDAIANLPEQAQDDRLEAVLRGLLDANDNYFNSPADPIRADKLDAAEAQARAALDRATEGESDDGN